MTNLKSLLSEGGAVGHLRSLHEARELSFKEMKMILRKAATGRLEKVTEKMDGQQLTFSYDASTDTVLAARSAGDIKRGGMNADELASKFAGRGSVEDAFNMAFKVINGAVRALPQKARLKVFGSSANRWYSAEIIYTKNPNVINYDSDSVIFHGWPVFKKSKSGEVEMSSDDDGSVDILTNYVDKMSEAVKSTGWKVKGPALVRMKKLSDGTIFQNAIDKIEASMTEAGVNDANTIEDFLRSHLETDISEMDLTDEANQMIVSRCLELDGAPGLNDIKKKLDKTDIEQVVQFVRNSPNTLKAYIRPIELAVSDFAVDLLKGLDSTLIADTSKEVERLRGEVKNAINAIETSGNEAAMSILAKQMAKLKSVENITAPLEGVVFIYKGNAFKFTGSFASVGQVLGLFRYGRAGVVLDK
jgi:hypothetical protein